MDLAERPSHEQRMTKTFSLNIPLQLWNKHPSVWTSRGTEHWGHDPRGIGLFLPSVLFFLLWQSQHHSYLKIEHQNKWGNYDQIQLAILYKKWYECFSIYILWWKYSPPSGGSWPQHKLQHAIKCQKWTDAKLSGLLVALDCMLTHWGLVTPCGAR